MLDTTQLLILAVVAAAGYLVYHGSMRDPREPPMVSSKIPIIGHLLGMMWYGLGYWNMQAKKHASHPIFALDMVFGKLYFANSPELMQAIQRNNKTIAFEPLLNFSVGNLAGINNKKTQDLMRDTGSGGQGLSAKIMHALTPTLVGRPLDRMNLRMVQLMRPLIDEMGEKSEFDLYVWCQDAITAASTDATYGPLNPYKDKEIADAFWDFENGLGVLMANTLPWLTARKPWKARKKAAAAILKWLRMNGHEQASELAVVRLRTSLQGGLTEEEYAQLEVPMLIAFVSNTVPATFWTLFDLYSRPQLLEDICKEVELNALSIATDGTHMIDISALREDCPLLLSTFQEILRMRTTSSPSRFITKDILLADKYLLKAGNMITMPSEQIGQRPEVWGETARVFDERRFMKPAGPSKDRSGDREPRRVGGFMAFGVSPTVCPGRHFASSEILGMVAMMILRYDIVPVGGAWEEPEKFFAAAVSITGPVKGKFPVNVKPRKEFEGTKWDFHVEEGKGQFGHVGLMGR